MNVAYLSDFILDSEENDPISPWRPKLVEGHTFPHQVLRVLYSNLGVCMDTSNLEDMYKALSILHAGRQVQTDTTQVNTHLYSNSVVKFIYFVHHFYFKQSLCNGMHKT